MNTINVNIQIKGGIIPQYHSPGASGLDLVASPPDDITIAPGKRELVPTGIFLEIPEGFEAQVRPRSGLAIKHGVTVLNTPGTIDSDYRGEVKVILVNLGEKEFIVRRGDRIAQLVFAPVSHALLSEKASLDTTDRGPGGFGSTGV
jgi:dUTP pyrophosphatase